MHFSAGNRDQIPLGENRALGENQAGSFLGVTFTFLFDIPYNYINGRKAMEISTLYFYDIGSLLGKAMSSGNRNIDLTVVFEEDMGLTEELLYRLHDYYPNIHLMIDHKIIGGATKEIINGRFFSIKKEDNGTFTLAVISTVGATPGKKFPLSAESKHKSIEDAVEAAISKMFQK